METRSNYVLVGSVVLALLGVTAAYGLVSEAAKRRFFAWADSSPHPAGGG